MNPPPTVFSQVLAGLNAVELVRAAAKYPMPRASRSLTAYDHRADLPASLGHRVVLPLDQTAPAVARILQHKPQRRRCPDLDGDLFLPVGRDRKTRTRAPG